MKPELPPPMTMRELSQHSIEQPDFILVTGDAFVDHPSFGAAVIARTLNSGGYSVGIIAQPDWKSVEAFKTLGRPRLAFLVTSGNLDSMVNHYSVSKHRRREDVYSPGARAGLRPDRAVIVYTNRIKQAYAGIPVIIGGLEASLRRFAHYDYWDDAVRHSILIDSGADLLLYGMAETAMLEVAGALDAKLGIADISYVEGTAYHSFNLDRVYEYESLPSYMQVKEDKRAYASAFMMQYEAQDAIRGKRLVQAHEKGYIVVNPPSAPLTTQGLDAVYALPYTRKPHPIYKEEIPALKEVEFSLTSCRGCFGACAFCALTFHQGRVVQSRSHKSLIAEAKKLTAQDGFKGYIHDVGGPTANFRKPACRLQADRGVCADRQCIGYEACSQLEADHSDYIALLRALRALKGVKKVFIRSGIRYDYVLKDKKSGSLFLRELVAHHVSGRLKVAPEHIDDGVLSYMNKPPSGLYDTFIKRFEAENRRQGKEQFVVPYFISSHPGCDLNAAIALAQYLKKTGRRPEQVQDFYPTPGTLATCMYYTKLDPRNMRPVYVAKSQHEKSLQRALMQFYKPQNHKKVREALISAGREDLIGYSPNCLIPPAKKFRP